MSREIKGAAMEFIRRPARMPFSHEIISPLYLYLLPLNAIL